jgi:Ca2+/Na+ antiporter
MQSAISTEPGALGRVIIAVLLVSALVGFGLFRGIKTANRAIREPAFLRRKLFWLIAVYCIVIIFGISQVVEGNRRASLLIILPLLILLVWWIWRAVRRIKNPPN